jgi:predicted nucleotidyltransferase
MSEHSIDIEKVREFLKEKEGRKQEQLEERYKEALRDCKNIISLIIEKYNPKRIYQWGSLLYPERFSEISDIDIAVEGIENYETFSRMYGTVSELSSFPVDLVELEKIHPLHADSIRSQGKLLYERDDKTSNTH